MPSRIAARSTTAGTPVKSCRSTRAGMNAISLLTPGSQRASASMSSAFTARPSSRRSMFSRRILSEYGSRPTAGYPEASRARRLYTSTVVPSPAGRD